MYEFCLSDGVKENKLKQEVAFFAKKAPQKNFATFTRDVATSPGTHAQKRFLVLFSKKNFFLSLS